MRVWYAAYGSNMSWERLRCYLEGGRPEGGTRVYEGARDRSPPSSSAGRQIPGELVFGGTSRTWGGGVAFLVEGMSTTALARLVDISLEQFCDVIAQENWVDVGSVVLPEVPDRGAIEVSSDLTYGVVLGLGTHAGRPIVTFTKREGEPAAPAPAYLRYVATGLWEAFGLDGEAIARYLSDKRGVRGSFSHEELVRLAR